MNDKKTGADTIKEAMKAMAFVKKMDIDPETGQVKSRENKSILEDIYDKSGGEIPVEFKKTIEESKFITEKKMSLSKDIVSSYYSMMNGVDKEVIIEKEKEKNIKIDKFLSVNKLPNEDAYMQNLVDKINKRR